MGSISHGHHLLLCFCHSAIQSRKGEDMLNYSHESNSSVVGKKKLCQHCLSQEHNIPGGHHAAL